MIKVQVCCICPQRKPALFHAVFALGVHLLSVVVLGFNMKEVRRTTVM